MSPERRVQNKSSRTEGQPKTPTIPVIVPPEKIWEKEEAVIQRFQDDQRILGTLRIDEGVSHREVDRRIKEALNVFMTSDRQAQIALGQQAGQAIDDKLKSIFNPNLTLLVHLLEETDQNPVAITTEIKIWEYLFDNTPRKERVGHALRLREEVGNRLVGNFDKYLQLWRRFLLETGTSRKDAGSEIDALRHKFSTASKKGKVGISRDLREKIGTGDSGRFSAFLDMYRVLLENNGNSLEWEDLRTPEEWEEMFNNASGTKRAAVISMLENRIGLILKPKPTPPELDTS